MHIIVIDKNTKYIKNIFKNLDNVVYTDVKYLYQKVEVNKNEIQSIIILAELMSEDYNLQDFIGFEIAKNLRIKYKYFSPIVLMSYYSIKHFELEGEKNPNKYTILYAPGTGYIDLSNVKKILQKDDDCIAKYISTIRTLDDVIASDIKAMLLDVKGYIIEKIMHNIKYTLSVEKIDENIKIINRCLCDEDALKINLSKNIRNIINAKKNGDEIAFNKSKDLLCHLIMTELAESKEIYEYNVKKNKPGKILVIEDDPEHSDQIKSNLGEYFDLIVCNDSSQAIKEIREDEINSIISVIADWRLFKYFDNRQTEYWQDYQGYEILYEVSKNHYASLISFTSEIDINIHRIRNILALDIKMFKKQNIFLSKEKAQWDLLTDLLFSECDKILEVISSDKHMGERWNHFKSSKGGKVKNNEFKPLKKQYIEARHKDWEVYENSISDYADKIWLYYKKALYPENERNLEDISKKWGLSLSKSGQPILYNILVLRRVWLALWFSSTKIHIIINGNDYPKAKIYSILKCDYYDEMVNELHSLYQSNEKTKIPRSVLKNEESIEECVQNSLIRNSTTLAFNLAIETSSLPDGILPEEKKWLKKNGICIAKGNAVYDINDSEGMSDDDIQEDDIEQIEKDIKRIVERDEGYGDECD